MLHIRGFVSTSVFCPVADASVAENLSDVFVRCVSKELLVDSLSDLGANSLRVLSDLGANSLRGRKMSGRGVVDFSSFCEKSRLGVCDFSRVGSSPDFPFACQRVVIATFPLAVMKKPGRPRGKSVVKNR